MRLTHHGVCMKKNVSPGSLCFPHLEFRLHEYAIIEQRIKDYLSKVGIEYDKLSDECRYATLVGAHLAIENAIFNNAMEADFCRYDKFSEEYKAFLQTLMPLFDFYEILTWIEQHSTDESAQRIQEHLVSKCEYPKHEAYLRALAIAVAGYVSADAGDNEQLDEALYCCYLHARKEFFLGNR